MNRPEYFAQLNDLTSGAKIRWSEYLAFEETINQDTFPRIRVEWFGRKAIRLDTIQQMKLSRPV